MVEFAKAIGQKRKESDDGHSHFVFWVVIVGVEPQKITTLNFPSASRTTTNDMRSTTLENKTELLHTIISGIASSLKSTVYYQAQ